MCSSQDGTAFRSMIHSASGTWPGAKIASRGRGPAAWSIRKAVLRAIGGSGRERSCQGGVLGIWVPVELGGRATCTLLDSLEFVEEIDPADGVFITGLETGASRTVKGWRGGLDGTGEHCLSVLLGEGSRNLGRDRGTARRDILAGSAVKEANVADAV